MGSPGYLSSPGPPPVLSVTVDGLPPDDPGVGEVLALVEYERHLGLGRGDGLAGIFLCRLTHEEGSIQPALTT